MKCFQQKKQIYLEIGDKLAIEEVENWVDSEPSNLEAINELSQLYIYPKQTKAILV